VKKIISPMTVVNYFLLLIGLFSFVRLAPAGEVLQQLPETVSAESKYLFFLHGNIVEEKGVASAVSKEYGFYEYKKILDELAKNGFVVISEVRGDDTKVGQYAKKIAGQVNILIEKGIPPGNITVAGFSKGGKITLVTSSIVGNQNINYVVLAGCIRNSDKFIKEFGLDLKGRVLSIVDYKDDTFSSCKDMFNSSSGGLEHKEIILKEGRGHAVFYSPNDKWIEPLVSWIK
jgi:hypothetical protein